MNQISPPQLLTEKQVAKALGIAPSTLRTWRCRKQGPRSVKVGSRAVRYDYRDILDFCDIEQETVSPDEW